MVYVDAQLAMQSADMRTSLQALRHIHELLGMQESAPPTVSPIIIQLQANLGNLIVAGMPADLGKLDLGSVIEGAIVEGSSNHKEKSE